MRHVTQQKTPWQTDIPLSARHVTPAQDPNQLRVSASSERGRETAVMTVRDMLYSYAMPRPSNKPPYLYVRTPSTYILRALVIGSSLCNNASGPFNINYARRGPECGGTSASGIIAYPLSVTRQMPGQPIAFPVMPQDEILQQRFQLTAAAHHPF